MGFQAPSDNLLESYKANTDPFSPSPSSSLDLSFQFSFRGSIPYESWRQCGAKAKVPAGLRLRPQDLLPTGQIQHLREEMGHVNRSMGWGQQFMDAGLSPFMMCFQERTFHLQPTSCSEHLCAALHGTQVITGWSVLPKVHLLKAKATTR